MELSIQKLFPQLWETQVILGTAATTSFLPLQRQGHFDSEQTKQAENSSHPGQ